MDLGPRLGYVLTSVLGPPRQDIQGSVVSSSPAPWFDSLLLALQSQASVGAASVGRRNRAHLGSNPVTAGMEHSGCEEDPNTPVLPDRRCWTINMRCLFRILAEQGTVPRSLGIFSMCWVDSWDPHELLWSF